MSGEASVILFGCAFGPDEAMRHPLISAAAAKWQMAFCRALANAWRAPVTCLSYVLLDGETGPQSVETRSGDGRVQVVPVARDRGFRGAAACLVKMARAAMSIREKPRCVVCYNAIVWTAPFGLLLAARHRVPVIMIVADFNDFDSRIPDALHSLVGRLFMMPVQRFLLLSAGARGVVGDGKRVVVWNGAVDEEALAAPAATYGGALRFVYAGSLGGYAGVFEFVAAAEILAAENADVSFHMFGRGELDVKPSRGLTPRLHVHGFVSEDELNRFLGSDCVGVNPRPAGAAGNRYNTPYKLIYYLSRGIATITTRTAGVPDDLADVCIPARQGPDGLAEAFRRSLAMAPDDLAALGARGRKLVAQTRSAEAMAEQVESLLR